MEIKNFSLNGNTYTSARISQNKFSELIQMMKDNISSLPKKENGNPINLSDIKNIEKEKTIGMLFYGRETSFIFKFLGIENSDILTVVVEGERECEIEKMHKIQMN
jgi:hypothetical protein